MDLTDTTRYISEFGVIVFIMLLVYIAAKPRKG
jgi:hypothetical protein